MLHLLLELNIILTAVLIVFILFITVAIYISTIITILIFMPTTAMRFVILLGRRLALISHDLITRRECRFRMATAATGYSDILPAVFFDSY